MITPDINTIPVQNTSYWLKKNYPDFYEEIMKIDGKSITERIYIFFHGRGICPCGKPTKFISLHNGYRKYCSCQCRSDNEKQRIAQIFKDKYGCHPRSTKAVQDKCKETVRARYGVDNVMHSWEIRDRQERVCMERYGSKSPFGSPQIQERIKQTNLERYGVENPAQSEEVQKKIKQTCLERYGDENYKNAKQRKQTCLERYGVENPFQSPEIREKIAQTCLERYGADNPLQSKEIQEKIRQTCLERYGVENIFESQEAQEQIKQTNLERYGVENPQQSPTIREKAIQTCLEKYGVESILESEEIQEKIKQTCLEKYGVEYVLSLPEIQEKVKQTCLERYGVENPSKSPIIREKAIQTCLERYGVPYGLLNTEPGYSKASQYLFDQLKEHFPNAIYATNGDEQRVGPYLLDWYDPDSNTVIEFNGDYWHANPKLYSEDWIHPIKKCTAKELWEHDREKKEYLESLGYKVIVIWESDIENDNEVAVNNIIKEIQFNSN